MLLNPYNKFSLKKFKCCKCISYVQFSTNDKNPNSNKHTKNSLPKDTFSNKHEKPVDMIKSNLKSKPIEENNFQKLIESLKVKNEKTIEQPKKINIKNILVKNEKENTKMKINIENILVNDEKQNTKMQEQHPPMPVKSRKFDFDKLVCTKFDQEIMQTPIKTESESKERYNYVNDYSERSKENFVDLGDLLESQYLPFEKDKKNSVYGYLCSILKINSIFGNVTTDKRTDETERNDLPGILKTLKFCHFFEEEQLIKSKQPSFISKYDPSMRLNIFSKNISQEQNTEHFSKTIDIIESHEYRKLNRMMSFNSFQESILLTNDKKMWNFPINNDQDSDELKIGFHEHVFPQQFLTGVLPTTGMIGQFMNYVCMGLSQNPHLTVTEKKAHIKWYEDYLSQKIEEIDMAMQKSIEDAKYEKELRNKR